MKKLLSLLLPLLLLCGCAGVGDGPELLEPAKVEADIETAYMGDIFNVVMYEASIEPKVTGQSFSSGGTIGKLNVTLGDVVKKGDVLADLDLTSVQAQRDALAEEIEYKQTNHDFEIKRLSLRAELQRQSGGGTAELEAQLIELQIQESDQLFAIEKSELDVSLAALDRTLKNDSLTASVSGTVVKMNAKPGGTVRGGSACVYIADDDTKVITCQYIASSDIEKCDRVYASIGGAEYDVEYLPYDRDEYLRLAISGAEMTSTFEILNPSDDIENGMFTCVYLVSDYVENALLAPSNAVHSDTGGSFVYLFNDGEQVKRYVETGVITDAEVQILSGLEEGDAFYVAS